MVKTRFPRKFDQTPLVIKNIGAHKMIVDMALVRDLLGLIKLQCGDDTVRGVVALIATLRVMHEQSGKLDVDRTAEEIVKVFKECKIEQGQVQ